MPWQGYRGAVPLISYVTIVLWSMWSVLESLCFVILWWFPGSFSAGSPSILASRKIIQFVSWLSITLQTLYFLNFSSIISSSPLLVFSSQVCIPVEVHLHIGHCSLTHHYLLCGEAPLCDRYDASPTGSSFLFTILIISIYFISVIVLYFY